MRHITKLKTVPLFWPEDWHKRLNFLLAGLLQSSLTQSPLSRSQLVQNVAARLLTGARKRDDIAPVLAALRWWSIGLSLRFYYLFLKLCTAWYSSTLMSSYAPFPTRDTQTSRSWTSRLKRWGRVSTVRGYHFKCFPSVNTCFLGPLCLLKVLCNTFYSLIFSICPFTYLFANGIISLCFYLHFGFIYACLALNVLYKWTRFDLTWFDV